MHPKALTALLILSAALPAVSQSIDTKIFFTGAAPYTDADLATVVGLHSGQLFTDNEAQAGAQRLIDTGLFDTASITGTGKDRTRQIRYTIQPFADDKLLPATFANFVWFTPDELDHALRTSVPLYRGLLSDSGNFADTVQAALQQLLKEKSITATVSHEFDPPSALYPRGIVSFHIDDPAIRLLTASLSLSGPPGAGVQLAPLLKDALNRAVGSAYNEGLTGLTIADRLLQPARDSGYAAAQLTGISRTVAPAASPSRGYVVTYTAKLITGDPYKIATIVYTPSPLYSATDFSRDSKLHPGNLSTGKALTETQLAILASYRTQGYMDAYIATTPALDPAAHTISYDIKAVPGEQYHLKSVTQLGLAPDARQQFDSAWSMKPGDIYNENYVAKFLNQNTSLLLLNKYNASFRALSDPQTHQTDLTITFVSKPSSH